MNSHAPAPARLLRTPAPETGEHLLGYLLRVANANGYYGYSPLAGEFGVRGMTPGSIIRAWLLSHFEFNHLADATCRDAKALSAHFARHGGLDATLFRTTRPRVCPKCLEESPILRAAWDFTPITFCVKHRVELVDHCPTCDSPLTWSRGQVLECPKGHDLRAIPTKAVTDDEWQTLQAADVGLPQPEGAFALTAQARKRWAECYALANALFRPFDLIVGAPKLNDLPNRRLHPLFVTAASVMRDADAAHALRVQTRAVLQKSFPRFGHLFPSAIDKVLEPGHPEEDLVALSPRQAEPLAMSWTEEAHAPRTASKAAHFGVLALRLNAARKRADQQSNNGAHDIEAALRSQIDMKNLCDHLGTRPHDLHSLADEGFLEPAHAGTPRYEDWLFDLRDFEALIESMQAVMLDEKTIANDTFCSFPDITRGELLKRHNTTLGRLLNAVKQHAITLYTPGERSLDGLLFKRNDLLLWLIDEIERPRAHYTFTQLAHLLELNAVTVSHLSSEGYLPVLTRKRKLKTGMQVAFQHVARFRQGHVALNAVARHLGTHVTKIEARLDDYGLRPCVRSEATSTITLILYPRTDALLQALDDIAAERGRQLGPRLHLPAQWRAQDALAEEGS